MGITLMNNGWLSVPYAEYISRSGSTMQFTAGYAAGNNTATYTILINALDLTTVIQEVLGTHTWNPVTKNIERSPELQHPHFPNLYASRLTGGKFVKWTGKGTSFFMNAAASDYRFCLLTFAFDQPFYIVLDDGELEAAYGIPRQEYYRYVETKFEPASTTLNREQGSFYYKTSGVFAGGPANGSPFRGALAQQVVTAELHLIWQKVPAYGLFTGRGATIPTNIMTCVETVNNAPFMGFPAQTLRLRPPRLTAIPSPSVQGIPDTFPQVCYTIDITMTYTNPNAGNLQQGHNLVPFPGDSLSRWWPVSTTSDGTGPGIFATSDFTQIFKLLG